MSLPDEGAVPRWRRNLMGDELSDREIAATPKPSAQIAAIVEAAEKAAAELREQTEARVRERIAEADRAAALRVEAAEIEAREIVEEAQRKAAVLHETAESDASRIRDQAEATATQIIAGATSEAAETQRIAEVFAAETRTRAEEEARDRIKAARALAGDVYQEGTQLSANLRALGQSLHTNADTLLRDVASAHRAMVASLDRLDPERATVVPLDKPRRGRPSEDLNVPEFIPRRA